MGEKPVSTVIYTKDAPDRVAKIVKKIKDYVDEIIVIDSSSPENFEELKRLVGKNARIYNLPALGIVEPFQKIGAKLAKNDWILHLDDDEIPSNELLRFLKNEFSPDKEVSVFNIPRKELEKNFINYQPRLYNKKKLFFSGIIHWGLIPTGIKKEFDKNKLLFHYEQYSYSFEKWKKYALIDAYVFGYKILWIKKNKLWHPHGNERLKIARIFSKLVEAQFRIEKIGWFLAVSEYLIFCIIAALKKGKIKYRLAKTLYYFFIYAYILKEFNKKIRVWENLFEAGSLNNYLGLNDLEDFEKLRDKNKKGLKLLISLIEEKVKENEK